MQLVISRTENDVGTIVMDNTGKRNALSEQLTGEIRAALDGFRGTGCERRCCGRRPAARSGRPATTSRNCRTPAAIRSAGAIRCASSSAPSRSFRRRSIALIEGGVWGGACEVAMACDILVATPDATFAITPAKLGIPYNLSGLLTLMNTIPLPIAKEMLFTAEPIPAQRAHALGVVNHLRAKDEIESFVYELAAAIIRNAPLSIAAMKEEMRLLASAHAMTPAMFERIQGLRRVVYDSGDYQEGIDAWRAKRPPQFGWPLTRVPRRVGRRVR